MGPKDHCQVFYYKRNLLPALFKIIFKYDVKVFEQAFL